MRLARLCAPLALLVSSMALADAADAPMSLTASDGTGLKLLKLQAKAVVQDPLAFTELTLTFENPLNRVLEGQFKITLPQGATVSRFAMKLDGRWQEGEVVERQAARRAYEDFLHRRQDPALLEQSGGNEFAAKVFPIPARGIKEVVLAYSHELVSSTADYTLPLKGLPEVGSLEVQVSGVEGGELTKAHYVPNADFTAKPVRHLSGVRSQDLLVARVVPVSSSESDPMTAVTLLVDSSASRALGWREQVTLVRGLVADFAAKTPQLALTVLAFDQQVAPIYAGPASGFTDVHAKTLLARRALGASNLEVALKAVQDKPTTRVVLLSDGVFTAGVTEGPNLQALLLKLKSAGVQRLDAIAVGGIRDDVVLQRLTTSGLPRDGATLDAAQGAAELARRLSLTTRSKLEVKVDGASQVWPSTLSGIQAGEAVLVYAQLSATSSSGVKVSVGGKTFSIANGDMASIERPLLERAWAKARIDALQARLDQADGASQREAIKKDIVELSTKSRVLSSLTALLVLETESDYARFHIDRRALADILTVQNGHVSLMKRSAETVVAASAIDRTAKPEPKADRLEKKALKAARDESDSKPQGASAEGQALDDGAALSNSFADKATAPKEVAASPPPPPSAAPAPGTAEESVLFDHSTTTVERVAANGSSARGAERRAPSSAEREPPRAPPRTGRVNDADLPHGADPYTGTFKKVMDALKSDKAKAMSLAWGWHEEQPGDLLALVALGEALEATGDTATAARAWGSIIDLFPARADLRRFAGIHLERLQGSLELAIDTFKRAAEQRADHPASHRMLAFSLLKSGKPEQAFEAISKGVKQRYPDGRFAGVDQILREDAGLIAAAWAKAEPARSGEIMQALKTLGGQVEDQPSLRFVLNWETDANDVDFHIIDAQGGHAFYSQPVLTSGGQLYADVTTGYGPECFTIRKPAGRRAAPYKLLAHYYSIGPMGAGMGKLEIIEHDGKGGLRFEERPYVVMVNQAFVDLGTVK